MKLFFINYSTLIYLKLMLEKNDINNFKEIKRSLVLTLIKLFILLQSYLLLDLYMLQIVL